MAVDESFTLRFEDQSPTKIEPLDEKKVSIDGSTQTEVFEDEVKNENEKLKRILAQKLKTIACLQRSMKIIHNEKEDLRRRLARFDKRIKLARNQESMTEMKEKDVTEIVKGKRLKSQLQRLKNNGVSVTMTNVAVVGPRKRQCEANPLSSENKTPAKKSIIEVIAL